MDVTADAAPAPGRRGGKRQGAGRPRLPADEQLVAVTVRLTRAQLEWLRTEGGGNPSVGLRRLLDELDQRQGAEAAARARASSASSG